MLRQKPITKQKVTVLHWMCYYLGIGKFPEIARNIAS